MHNKSTCGSSDRSLRDTEQNYSADDDRKDQWDDKETDTSADDEEEEPNDDTVKNQTQLLLCMKRSASTTGEKPQVKRRIKSGHFLSRLSSDEETETGDESDSSFHTPFKCQPTSNLQPTAY